jgi:esterase/lipase
MIMEQVIGGEHIIVDYAEEAKQFWNEKYHKNGVLALQYILDEYMTDDYFNSITQPVLVGVYYKDETNQDNVISVEAAEDFYNQIGTPKDKKRFLKFPNVNRHVLSSSVFSNDLESVEKATIDFIEEVLLIEPIIN